MGAAGTWWRLLQAGSRQGLPQYRLLGAGMKDTWHTGQVAAALPPRDGVSGSTGCPLTPEALRPCPGGPPAGVRLDLDGDGTVQEAVQHGGGHHGVVEDLAPGADPKVCREGDGALQVALGDHLEQGCPRLPGKRLVAHFVDDEQPRSGVEAHDRGPPALQGRLVAAG